MGFLKKIIHGVENVAHTINRGVADIATGGLYEKFRNKLPSPPAFGNPPDFSNQSVQQAEEDERRRSLGGRASTILNGPQGIRGAGNLAARALYGAIGRPVGF